MKRLVSIQDLSCIGRCSLGVAMSVIPAMGIETAALPTALLSTHTQFEGFTFLDLTEEAEKIIAHWKAQKMTFDTIYIGYLGSVRLIHMASEFIESFRSPDTRVVLDPAFGDNGVLYKGFDECYVAGIRDLCARADIILPNITEACYLLGEKFEDGVDATSRIAQKSQILLSGHLRSIVLTSCRFEGGQTGVICVGEGAFAYPHELLNISCHGSGDVFASVFAGFLTLGRDMETAARMAADFTYDSLKYSMQCPDHRWYGLDFEPMLSELVRRI